ncbi:MAG: hypothetical protein NVSMB25_03910 [Thermoleophilaceae bacterium]
MSRTSAGRRADGARIGFGLGAGRTGAAWLLTPGRTAARRRLDATACAGGGRRLTLPDRRTAGRAVRACLARGGRFKMAGVGTGLGAAVLACERAAPGCALPCA